jgi:hypothetical protein
MTVNKTKTMKKYLILLFSGLIILGIQSCSHKIDSTESLMNEIAKRYNGKWFKQIKFSQTTTFYSNDTVVKTERWIEEYRFPSQLIIKVNHENSADGQLYRNDSVYVFENNKVVYNKPVTHDVVIMSMDIYNMEPDDIMKRLEGLPYNLNKFREDEFEGRKIYVIGADKGDTTTNQVWFDAEHLYFVKMIKNTPNGLQEIILGDYINFEGQGWIEQEVIFKLDGMVYLKEKYYNISIPVEAKPEIQVSDFGNFSISVNQTIQYIIEYTVSTQGKRLIMLF